MISFTSLMLVTPSLFMGSYGSILLKKGSHKFSLNPLELIKNFEIILGLVLFVFATIFYTIALKYEDLSTLYPLSSVAYILVSLLSVKFLNEKMNIYKWLGIAFIFAGSFLVVR